MTVTDVVMTNVVPPYLRNTYSCTCTCTRACPARCGSAARAGPAFAAMMSVAAATIAAQIALVYESTATSQQQL
ncbi:hypothetical protein [Streptomyces geranii]|uniref:hypothetical protein n=1 Tax=Streptomyces geranii TaxID=2058923 RepID=UPI001300B6AE|nr:hypothetical protein [Streptomyces geranii]